MKIIAAVILVVVALCISASFRLLGAKMAKIDNRTFSKALKSASLGGTASIPIAFIAGLIPIIGWVLGLAVSYLIMVMITLKIFNTTPGKAFVVETLHAGFGFVIITVGTLFMLLMLTQGSDVDPFIYTLFWSISVCFSGRGFTWNINYCVKTHQKRFKSRFWSSGEFSHSLTLQTDRRSRHHGVLPSEGYCLRAPSSTFGRAGR